MSTKEFRAVKIHCDTTMVDTCHYGSNRCPTARVNPKVNCGLYMITLCQRSFINCNKCATLVGGVDNEGSWEQGVHREFLYLPFSFAVNLKLL